MPQRGCSPVLTTCSGGQARERRCSLILPTCSSFFLLRVGISPLSVGFFGLQRFFARRPCSQVGISGLQAVTKHTGSGVCAATARSVGTFRATTKKASSQELAFTIPQR